MKTITITFQVPDGFEATSERLAEVKQLLLDGVSRMEEAHKNGKLRLPASRVDICEALLTEI